MNSEALEIGLLLQLPVEQASQESQNVGDRKTRDFFVPMHHSVIAPVWRLVLLLHIS
jgi:hypothetical protein